MEFLINEKFMIVGVVGMIGFNMVQIVLMMKLILNICLYDFYVFVLEGVVEELYYCVFEGVNLIYILDIKEVLLGVKYIVFFGGVVCKVGMICEDLLKGNVEIVVQFGKDIC